MANWSGAARTNYFHVKDLDAFTAAAARFSNLDVSPEDPSATAANKRSRVCVLETDGSGWPTIYYDEDTDTDEEVDLARLIAEHLADGEVAVLMEVGFEKLRYLTGFAVAVNSSGETRHINLEDIYQLAEELAHGRPVTAVAS